jgi:hypothetical protein
MDNGVMGGGRSAPACPAAAGYCLRWRFPRLQRWKPTRSALCGSTTQP